MVRAVSVTYRKAVHAYVTGLLIGAASMGGIWLIVEAYR